MSRDEIQELVQSSERQIGEAIAALETRKVQLKRIIGLRLEVEALERDAMSKTSFGADAFAICEVVCAHYRLGFDVLMSRLRTQEVANVRHVAFYICREMTGVPLMPLGKIFDRDHGAILHGYQHVVDRMSVEPDFAETVKKLIQQCAARLKVEQRLVPGTAIKKWVPKA